LALSLIALSGCAGQALKGVPSVTDAGTTSIHTTPVFGKPGESVIGIKYDIVLGKEYEAFDLSLTWSDEGRPIVTVRAVGVKAFEGQRSAQAITLAIQQTLSAAGVEVTESIMQGIGDAVKASIFPPSLLMQ